MRVTGIISTTTASISLKKELYKEVREYCENTGRTISGFMTTLLKKHFSEIKTEEKE